MNGEVVDVGAGVGDHENLVDQMDVGDASDSDQSVGTQSGRRYLNWHEEGQGGQTANLLRLRFSLVVGSVNSAEGKEVKNRVKLQRHCCQRPRRLRSYCSTTRCSHCYPHYQDRPRRASEKETDDAKQCKVQKDCNLHFLDLLFHRRSFDCYRDRFHCRCCFQREGEKRDETSKGFATEDDSYSEGVVVVVEEKGMSGMSLLASPRLILLLPQPYH